VPAFVSLGALALRRLARNPFVFWAATAVLVVATGSAVARTVAASRADAARYGPLRPMLVATRPVAVGSTVAPADVDVRMVPAGVLPDRALATPDDARDRTVVVALLPGVPVVRDHLSPDGRRGVAALLPPGRRALAVPLDAPAPPLRPGDLVDVLATFDGRPARADAAASPVGSASGDGLDGTEPFAITVAESVAVLHVTTDADTPTPAVTIAVTPEEAARVAMAVGSAAVTLALAGPEPVAGDEDASFSERPAAPARPLPRPPGRPRTG